MATPRSDTIKTTLEEGSGPNPKIGDTVIMAYTGWLRDPSQPDNKGAKFDSSYDRRTDFVTEIGTEKVIKGWDAGVPQMKVGEKARLEIPYYEAYGDRGYPPIIPARSDLIFDVHLKAIR
ncbi:uncharacterized protein TRIREDRAFT_104211 [Trichoderma reesei QM6a]|uniref:peptidylprolyl isomerase n=2 Tax=Hypocrea jecorina TaxID=51453 RepID=G0RBR8_HYPJQ|nr:uncharacterized protein TRIREDRAFT_104211 [Trichoderma reesei QM6a]EGR51102.1 predicted protein [Trichoderma reesei QM6a]ETS04725.1 rapamycin binding protein FKBP12 [Trichoderma reesei RUT C-30]